jgi:uncharacterized protein (UPF0264 family)
MVRLLVSIRDVNEAVLAVGAGVDIVDVKDPDSGVLGQMASGTISAIVAAVGNRYPTSATTGDLLPGRDDICAAAEQVAATGVDFVKVGFWPGHRRRTIQQLGERVAQRAHLVGVLLADMDPDFSLLPVMAEAGFAGAMMDVAGKGTSLPNRVTADHLATFIARCRDNGLMSGLAGSLRIDHIPFLVGLAPDVLGFRGGLCVNLDRTLALDAAAVSRAVAVLRRAQTVPALAS